ncbi:MAG: hypothetical protein Q7T74_06780 [Candidatus Saccharibacteria bacterium]|nr:hypothetical protein [Candidatus Saccharibacteria bacterium]
MERFISSESGLKVPGAVEIVQAWELLQHEQEQNSEALLLIYGKSSALRTSIRPRKRIQQFVDGVNGAVTEQLPGLTLAMDGLRSALTQLQGQPIGWWQDQGPMPDNRLDNELLDGIIRGDTLVEDDNRYYRFGGEVVGSVVQFNKTPRDFGAWIQVADNTNPAILILHSFDAMYGIHIEYPSV